MVRVHRTHAHMARGGGRGRRVGGETRIARSLGVRSSNEESSRVLARRSARGSQLARDSRSGSTETERERLVPTGSFFSSSSRDLCPFFSPFALRTRYYFVGSISIDDTKGREASKDSAKLLVGFYLLSGSAIA